MQSLRYSFFFFQAEDGIRDKLVTGVQTCALPISRQEHESRALAEQQAAAPAVEGPYAVPRERPERVEAAHDEAAEDVVPSRDDQVRRVRPQEIRRDAERRGARRAGRGDGYHRSTGPEPQRERADRKSTRLNSSH